MAQENWSEETDCQAPPEAPVFCTNNCGFVGSSATMNMCTKCYTDLSLLEPQTPSKNLIEVTAIHSGVTELTVNRTTCSNASIEAEIVVPPLLHQAPKVFKEMAGVSQLSQERRPNLVPSRCLSCKRRVGLTGFKCRCGDLFCALHRYAEKHNCTFDYKAVGRDAIAKANPLIKADKIRRI